LRELNILIRQVYVFCHLNCKSKRVGLELVGRKNAGNSEGFKVSPGMFER
jgi:hypothetical protein